MYGMKREETGYGKSILQVTTAKSVNQLIVEYAQLVKLVAGRMNMYLGY